MRQASALLLACACAAASQARQDLAFGEGSVVFDRNGPVAESSKRALTGRFMHITDFHPDPHYETGATFDSGCHERPKKKKGKKGKKGKSKAADTDEDDSDDEAEENADDLALLRSGEDLARPWGSAVSDCDSPMALVNYTFDWLKKEWADEVDFVIWTGDNARHDIDRNLPRTPKEILELNTMMATRMRETFGSDVVIVPSLGNNDIYPHNVMSAGPTTLTESMLRTWKHFIPDDYDHVFERGAYFASEVIPDQLAVISLNTLYWYDSNTLVDGCVDGSSDPGALEFDWLEVQLDGFRERGMQVWLTGHVPPHSGNYYDTCWLRYGDLSLRYQDTIVGHLYGHMNIDHFFFMDVPELESRETKLFANSFNENRTMSIKSTLEGPPLRHGDFNAASGRFRTTGRNGNAALVDTLRRDFGDMPGPNKLRLKDYAVMNVAPSIIPTYIPAVRIYSYNVSVLPSLDANNDFKRKHGHRHGGKKPKYKCKSPTDIDKPHCRFKTRPRYFNRTSPARRNGPLTPLGYAQFYLPEIDTATKDAPPEWKIEYSTFKLGNLLPRDNGTDEGQNGQKVPVPVKFLPGYDEEVLGLLIKERDERETEKGRERVQRQDRTEERTLTEEEYEDDLESLELDEQEEDWWLDDSGLRGDDGGEAESPSIEERTRAFKKSLQRITPWKMNDLTIPQYVKLARKLVAEKKMWKQFSNLMFVSAL